MPTRLKYRFSVVRFMPNQIRGEFVNIGIILHVLDTQQLMSEWLPGLGRMRCISPDVTVDEFKNFQHHLSERYNLDSSLPTLDAPESIVGESFNRSQPELLDYLHREWSVPFQFSEPVTGFTTDPKRQLEHLYNQMVQPIEDTAELTTPTRTSVDKVKRKFERELIKAGLFGPDKISKGIEVPGLTQKWPFNYGRVNGKITILQVVNLDLKDPVEKSDRAMILNGRVNDVRDKKDYSISDIDAFAIINHSKRAEDMEGLVEAIKLLKYNGINTVEEGEIPEIVEPLRQIIEAPKYSRQTWLIGN